VLDLRVTIAPWEPKVKNPVLCRIWSCGGMDRVRRFAVSGVLFYLLELTDWLYAVLPYGNNLDSLRGICLRTSKFPILTGDGRDTLHWH